MGMGMNELKCLHCGKPLIKTGAKPPKYCNPVCRYRHMNGLEVWEKKPTTCVVCSTTFLPRDSRQVCCSDECSRKNKNGRSSHEYTCRKCGRVYQAKEKCRDKYCSRECAFSDAGAWHFPAAKVVCPKCGVEFDRGKGCSSYCSPECRDAAMTRRCEICQRDFVATVSRGRLCSDECRAESARQYAQKRDEERHRAKGTVRQCKICGALFCVLYGSKQRLFCSDKCKEEQLRRDKRAQGGCSNTQRAKRLGLPRKYFNERKILERDKWTCYLCGQPTPPELRGTYEPNAPELDHIVPLSKGGAHIKENVACICRRCNGKKGNRTLGEMGLTDRVCVTQTRLQF